MSQTCIGSTGRLLSVEANKAVRSWLLLLLLLLPPLLLYMVSGLVSKA